MLGDSDSAVLGAGSSSADAAAVDGSLDGRYESGEATAAGGAGSNSGEELIGDRSLGGNRWPRHETMALLKIRSDMDVAFRDATVKGPLWEEVSRKLAEVGYNRSAKKCKEKFENVYKYHKRTKQGRSGKPDGKTYRFFDQLQAIQTNPSMHSSSKPLQIPQQANPSVPSMSPIPMKISQGIANPSMNPTFSVYQQIQQASPTVSLMPQSTANPTATSTMPAASLFESVPVQVSVPVLAPTDLLSNSASSSWSTSSDDDVQGQRGNKRKRKWKDFFERLMKEVTKKQEEMQKRFVEAIERREHERTAREEAWRTQEMVRINREREILAQERSMAAAKDAAVMSLLQKIAEQQNLGQEFSNINFPAAAQPQQQPPPVSPLSPVQHSAAQIPPVSQPQPQPLPLLLNPQTTITVPTNIGLQNKTEQNYSPASSSRWPKMEIQALIQLRTNLDTKYQDSGPKGPLWEEISAAMRKLGYNRNAKRCKEKWENINKYFKKVKESNKKRPEDSKTCPYYHLLDAIYKEKNKFDNSSSSAGKQEDLMMDSSTIGAGSAPLMVQPEQQWPPQAVTRPGLTVEEHHEDDDEEDDEGGSNFEVVPSKASSGD